MTYSILSDADIVAIHQATLRILEETGIVLKEPTAVKVLTESGAKVFKNRVIIPPDLVEKTILSAGKKPSIRGRGGAQKVLGDGHLYFHNLGGAALILDAGTKTRRPAVVKDVCDATRLLDTLENCHTITPFFTPTDVPGTIMSLAMYRHALPNTLKPVQGPGIQFPAEARFAVKMAEIIGDPQQVLTLALSPVSPLTIPDHEAAAIMEIARLGISFGPLPCPTAGSTAPMSIAGAVAQQNAEILSAMVLAQLVHPGLPMIYCGRLAMLEPRTGLSVWGGVELGLASALTVQLGHYYGFPVNVYGFSTNSHGFDLQNGFERGINALLPAIAGADELSGIGEMEAGVMGSYAQMVTDNELAASILRLRKKNTIDADALAVEIINDVMNNSRNFLGQKHTIKYLKEGEVLLTKLAERGSWESWVAGGRQELSDHAQAQAEQILREHKVPPLDPVQERELDVLLHAAEIELSNEHAG